MSDKITGFKEWTSVCQAMGSGLQSVILRKGGIHEGKGGFSFEYPAFFLFPTGFHAQWELLKPDVSSVLDTRGVSEGETEDENAVEENRAVTISHFAQVERTTIVERWEVAEALDPYHVWTPSVVEERFEYTGDRRLHVAFVRVFRLEQPWTFPYEKRFGGCRSWLDLPMPPDVSALKKRAPVLDDDAFAEVREAVYETLDSASL